MDKMERSFCCPGRIAVVANLQETDGTGTVPDEEAEFDSPETVEAVRAALAARGEDVVILEAGPEIAERLKETKPDLVFNLAEGTGGRDREAQVPALLSLMKIPYTGSDALVMSLTLDKSLCKRVASSFGIRTAPTFLFEPGCEIRLPEDGYPYLLKPNAEGSGKGITETCVAEDPAQMGQMLGKLFDSYGETILAEPYLEGREFTVGILGNGERLTVFPPMEIVYRHPTQGRYRIYSYEIKKNYRAHVDYVCPAEIPEEAEQEMKEAAEALYRGIGCADLARVDFRMDREGRPYFLEMNPLPGLAPGYSDYPMAAEAAGYAYTELIRAILEASLDRLGIWKGPGTGWKTE